MAKAESLRAGSTADSPTRRAEILATAASLIASSGLRTSLQEIADAAGILPGSLYHHFESKEAILVELIRRYQDDLERIGRAAQARLTNSTRVRSRSRSSSSARRSPTAPSSTAPPCRCRSTRAGHRPGADQADPAAAGGHPGGDAADAARRPVERLHQTRHRPAHAGRPHLPNHAAGRSRRHAAHRIRRPGRRTAVPNHLAGLGKPAAQRRRAGPVEGIRRRQRGDRNLVRRQRRRSR